MAVIEATGGSVVPPDGINRHIITTSAPGANAFAGQVRLGGLLVDVVGAKLYICTATNGTSTATWTVVGLQT